MRSINFSIAVRMFSRRILQPVRKLMFLSKISSADGVGFSSRFSFSSAIITFFLILVLFFYSYQFIVCATDIHPLIHNVNWIICIICIIVQPNVLKSNRQIFVYCLQEGGQSARKRNRFFQILLFIMKWMPKAVIPRLLRPVRCEVAMIL